MSAVSDVSGAGSVRSPRGSPDRKGLSMHSDSRYPFDVGELAHALRAAGVSISPDEVARVCMDSSGLARLLARAVVSSAPMVGSTTLLNHADELWGYEPPECSCDCVSWWKWNEASRMRERASELANWNEVVIPTQRRESRVFISFPYRDTVSI